MSAARVQVGQLIIAEIAPRDGRPLVWIEHADGEAGEFETAKLEAVLMQFFNQEF